MLMQQHILAAMREELGAWDAALAGLSEEQLAAAQVLGHWTIKDVIAHLWAWQQRSIARIEAALHDREPVFPAWPVASDPDGPGGADQANAWIYTTHRDMPWPQVYGMWREGYRRFVAAAERIAERDLLDSGRYAWMAGSPLAFVLLASYDHHQEHLDGVRAWLRGQRPAAPSSDVHNG